MFSKNTAQVRLHLPIYADVITLFHPASTLVRLLNGAGKLPAQNAEKSGCGSILGRGLGKIPGPNIGIATCETRGFPSLPQSSAAADGKDGIELLHATSIAAVQRVEEREQRAELPEQPAWALRGEPGADQASWWDAWAAVERPSHRAVRHPGSDRIWKE